MVARIVACNGDDKPPTTDDAILQIAQELVDTSHPLHVESLLDALVAIFHDCNLPILKRMRSVEMFLSKYEPIVNRLIKHRMNVQDFSIIKVIGRGACGEVQLVRHKRTHRVFAMKRLDKSEVIRRYDFSFFWEERDIMAHSNSEWIVQMYYSFQDLRYLYMVMQYMPGGDLVNLMSREDISEEMARFYIAELVLALDALHSLGYIHRDVKPDNMLISSSGHVKLADFGTCVKLNEDGKIKCATAAGTPDYISPEVLNSQCSESVYGIEVDYWSVGIILYEMLFGDPPFYADSLVNTYARIQNFEKELKFPTDIEISSAARDIIKRFLSAAHSRLGAHGAAEVRAHPFFKNDKWNFDNIRNATPPFVPRLTTDDDTSNFEDVTPADQNSSDSFQIPKAFNGAHLSFIGFTYANEFSPALSLQLQNGMLNGMSIVQTNGKLKNGKIEEIENGDSRLRYDEETRTLRNQLAALELKAAEQIQQVDVKTSELHSLQSELNLLKQKFADEKAAYEKKSLQTTNELSELRSCCDDLTSKLRAEKQEKSSTKDYYEERHASQQAVLASKDAQISQLQSELEAQTALLHRERQEQAQRLHCEQIGSRVADGLEERIKKQSDEIDKLRQKENSDRSEIWALKEQKTTLDSALTNLQNDKNRLEARFNSLKEEHYTAQNLVNVYKLERDDARSELMDVERVKEDLERRVRDAEDRLREMEEQLRSEQIARRMADTNVNQLESAKGMMEGEIESFMRRVEKAEAHNKQLQEALNRARDDSRMGPPGNRSNTGPVIHHQQERSSESLNHAVSTTSLNDLDGLSREQLIVRCRREISLKKNAIDKLLIMGTTKGIETEHQSNRTKGGKKQQTEMKRQREMWDQEHAKERQDWKKRETVLENELDLTRSYLQEEMNKNMNLKQHQHDMERQLNFLRDQVPPAVARHAANGMSDCVSKKKRGLK
ncbi:hypothetical protein M3Y95_00730800 [Aphelenchoides besseyi]|nr:hypothetical protein M3Y95_00730800 [Aphelenchoides besseyi]